MRILLTGAAGFIGSHIADAALAAGHELTLLDSLLPDVHPANPYSWPAYVPVEDRVRRIIGDVRDRDVLDDALRGIDVVCHQAAKVGLGVSVQDLPAYCDINVTGTAQLLAAMDGAGVDQIVVASSMVVYGEGRYLCETHGVVQPGPRLIVELDKGEFEPPCPRCGRPLTSALVGEDAMLDPRNAYATSKLAQEHLAASWATATSGRATALRYHNVYGPRMPRDTPYAGVAAIFRSSLERGVAPRVFEDGAQRRDFIHVRDIAAANLAAMTALADQRSASLRCYNVASGTPHTIGEMATALGTAHGAISPIITGEYRLGDVRHVVADPAAARRDLGFTAAVDFERGMREFAAAPLR